MQYRIALALFSAALALFFYTALLGTSSPTQTWVIFAVMTALFGVSAFLAYRSSHEKLLLVSLTGLLVAVPALLFLASLVESLTG